MPDPAAKTPLHGAHLALGARMVPFAGYDMPVQYPQGIIAEHQWTRGGAGLFDVSHMGQCALTGADFDGIAGALERLVPADIRGLAPGQQRYTQLLTADGGILDDLMVTRSGWPDGGDRIYAVVNASRKDFDFAHIAAALPAGIRLERLYDLALVALQGPKAEAVLVVLAPETAGLGFMQSGRFTLAGIPAHVSRSGYTGEDGFEISIAADAVEALWAQLLDHPDVRPVGLGARDSLRLEAGLCLYGHELDETTSPVEAGLVWSMGKARRTAGGFPGAARIQRELKEGPARRRVGLKPEGRAPAREGAAIATASGERIGIVTSGGFGPSVGGPIAMGYVTPAHAAPGSRVNLIVRDRPLAAEVVALPFVANRFKR